MFEANTKVFFPQGGEHLVVDDGGSLFFQGAGVGASGVNVLNQSGVLLIERLPTEDPGVLNAVYASGGVLCISGG